MLHLWEVFTKRHRTARLLGVANLLFQHPHGLTARQIAERIGMRVPFWQDGNRYGAEPTSLLPPLKLTLHEAVTLFVSARLMMRFQDHRDPHVISAFNKLSTILPSPIAQHVQATVAWLVARPPDDTRTRIFDMIATGWAEGRKIAGEMAARYKSVPSPRQPSCHTPTAS